LASQTRFSQSASSKQKNDKVVIIPPNHTKAMSLRSGSEADLSLGPMIDHRRIFNGDNEGQRAAVLGTGGEVDGEDAFE